MAGMGASEPGGGRRILIAGLGSHWGGRLAQRLERDGRAAVIIGVDERDPRHALDRTEFVRVAAEAGLLRRIIRAARIDTIVDARLHVDAPGAGSSTAHEINVEQTGELLAAARGAGSPVRKLVLRSSALVYGSDRDDPAFFTEEMAGGRPPRGELERSLVDAEALWHEFAQQHPQTIVTVLRFAAAIGGEARGALPSLLGLALVPSILGFDPRWQFIHEDDVLGVLHHAVAHDLPGIYNAAADGVLPLSEVVSLLGKAPLPVLPPWGTVFAAIRLRRLGLPVPVELLRDLRYGRGLDNRRLKAAGYRYGYTSREAVLELRSHQRLRPLLGSGAGSYRYERAVEEFLRWSPSVQRLAPTGAAHGDGELSAEELLVIIPSLEPDAIRALRDREAAGRARADLLAELDRQLELRGS